MADRAIFLDRDGTLIHDAGYINDPEQVRLLDGVPDALIKLKAMGFDLVVASNQSGVARGIVTEQMLGQIHSRLNQVLAGHGVVLDKIYYCPYHPDGVVQKYRRESDWRKPSPGMLLAAAREMNIDLSRSWAIGNSLRDVEAGRRVGCKTILIDEPGHKRQTEPGRPGPDFTAVNMTEAVNIIRKYERTDHQAQSQAAPVIAVPVAAAPVATSQAPQQCSEQPNACAAAPAQPVQQAPEGQAGSEQIEHLLERILEQIRSLRRDNIFTEFSVTRFLAGVIQIAVLFCLLICVWFLISPAGRGNSAIVALGFAMVLQTMALTFYLIRERK